MHLKIAQHSAQWVLCKRNPWVLLQFTLQSIQWVLCERNPWVLSQFTSQYAHQEPELLIKSSFKSTPLMGSQHTQCVLFKELTKNSKFSSISPLTPKEIIEYMVEYIMIAPGGSFWKNSWWVAQVLDGHIVKWIVKEPRGFFHKVPTGYFAEWIVKELKGFFYKVPTGHCAELFLKVFTLYPVNIGWANCFRTHHEPTMYPLGKWPLAPSVTSGSPVKLITLTSLTGKFSVWSGSAIGTKHPWNSVRVWALLMVWHSTNQIAYLSHSSSITSSAFALYTTKEVEGRPICLLISLSSWVSSPTWWVNQRWASCSFAKLSSRSLTLLIVIAPSSLLCSKPLSTLLFREATSSMTTTLHEAAYPILALRTALYGSNCSQWGWTPHDKRDPWCRVSWRSSNFHLVTCLWATRK